MRYSQKAVAAPRTMEVGQAWADGSENKEMEVEFGA